MRAGLIPALIKKRDSVKESLFLIIDFVSHTILENHPDLQEHPESYPEEFLG